MDKRIFGIGLILTSCLTGCASIVSGTNQSVSVNTSPVVGATCKLNNTSGTWYVNTPGSVTISRSSDPVHVDCEKDGHEPANQKVPSQLRALVAGNILFGGIPGFIIDLYDGAAFDYPQEIVVAMSDSKVIA